MKNDALIVAEQLLIQRVPVAHKIYGVCRYHGCTATESVVRLQSGEIYCAFHVTWHELQVTRIALGNLVQEAERIALKLEQLTLTRAEAEDLQNFVQSNFDDSHCIGDAPIASPAALQAMQKLLRQQ